MNSRKKSLAVCLILLSTEFVQANPNRPPAHCESPFDRTAKKSTAVNSVENLIVAYKEKLGFFRDPFAFVFDLEQGQKIFSVLSYRTRNGKKSQTPLVKINDALKKSAQGLLPFDEALLSEIITDATQLLSDPEAVQSDFQSNLLALKYTLEYLDRFPQIKYRAHQFALEEQPEKAFYPELPSKLSLATPARRSPGKKNETQKSYPIAEANFKTTFFVQRYLSAISKDPRTPIKEIYFNIPRNYHAKPPDFRQTTHRLKIYPYGRKQLSLFFVPGFIPLQPSNSRATIARVDHVSHEYVLKIDGDLSEVDIPLIEEEITDSYLMSQLIHANTTKVGFKNEEWPQNIREQILASHSAEDAQKDPLSVARAIENFFLQNYSLTLESRDEKELMSALSSANIQSIYAVYGMTALLRDSYEIPSRIGLGYRAWKPSNAEDRNSYLILPNATHAWVEVFHNGKWHLFDPTPTNRKGTDLWSEKASSDEKKPPHKKEPPDTQTGVGPSLSISKPTHNLLLERLFHFLLRDSLNPYQSQTVIQNKLNSYMSVAKPYVTPQRKILIQNAYYAHKDFHPDLINWIKQLLYSLPNQDISTSYAELKKIILSVESYAQLLDEDLKNSHLNDLLHLLREAQNSLGKLAHPQSEDIGIVREFVEGLPPMAVEILSRNYGYTVTGPNVPTFAIAADIKANKLKQLRLLALVYPLSHFILSSARKYDGSHTKVWQSNPRHRLGRDLLPVQRFSDGARAILGHPEESLIDNMIQGSAFLSLKRKTTLNPKGSSIEDSERFTVIAYDTSGSMLGAPARFQAALIAAFAARALSDVSPSGRYRQGLAIMGFDEKPQDPEYILHRESALDLLFDYENKLKNTFGFTNIQAALIQQMKLIAQAEKKNGDPLALANVILMSDGQANIVAAELLKQREAFSDRTPLQTMFIAINNTNQELMSYALDSESMGADEGLYREFTTEQIDEILYAADHFTLSGSPDAFFYSDLPATQINPYVNENLDHAQRQAARFLEDVENISYSNDVATYLGELGKEDQHDVRLKRPLEHWLIELRKVFANKNLMDQKLRKTAVADLLIHFQKVTGIPLTHLNMWEQEHLRHLVNDIHAPSNEKSP